MHPDVDQDVTRTHAYTQQLQQTQLPTQFDASSRETWTSAFPKPLQVPALAAAGTCWLGSAQGSWHPQAQPGLSS